MGTGKSDREIAKHCGVDHKTVASLRKDLELSGEIHQIADREVKRGDSTFTQNTANIRAANTARKTPKAQSSPL
jgi:hypothetical protein